MSIDTEKAIKLIGHASSSPELNDFLAASGIKKRLTAKDLPSTELSSDNNAVVLAFTSSYEEYYGKPFSDGFLFLEMVIIRNPKHMKKVGPLASKLPMGLRIDMIEDNVVSTLGRPSHRSEMRGMIFLIYNELIKGKQIIIDLDPETKEIKYINISPVRIDL